MSRTPTDLALYSGTARESAAVVVARYSTSFGLACRLLGARTRPHVRTLYALVRVADEIVDGPAAAVGLSADQVRGVLDDLETETLRAVERGFSANLVVHAFAATARECAITAAHVTPFFASMRADLTVRTHDAASHDDYVYGSAEVVGLMCLQIFVNAGRARPISPDAELVDGARRLGAAFQDINFLRDAAHDKRALGRDYLAADDRAQVLDRIDADLDAAADVIGRLPGDCRRAVTAAHDLFAELAARLRTAPPGSGRVRVPDAVKAVIALRAAAGRAPRRRREAARAVA